MPLPNWTGVPVALPLEVEAEILTTAAEMQDVGILYARDEEGDVVHCAAVIDAAGNHTRETDSILMLVQCGPFEFNQDEEQE